MITKAVIPAAGKGTRYGDAAAHIPKEMFPVLDKPVVQHVVEELIRSGIKDIILITRPGKRAIEDHFDCPPPGLKKLIEDNGVKFFYTAQPNPKGLGHAVLQAERHVGNEPFVLALGDDIFLSKIPVSAQLVELYNKYRGPNLAVKPVPKKVVNKYGIVETESINGGFHFVKDMVEKPEPDEVDSNLAIVGRYVLTPDIFDAIRKTKPGKGGEIQITDAIKILSKQRKIYSTEVEGIRYDAGDVFGRIDAENELMRRLKNNLEDTDAEDSTEQNSPGSDATDNPTAKEG